MSLSIKCYCRTLQYHIHFESVNNPRVPLPPEHLNYTLDEAIELMEIAAQEEKRLGHGKVQMSVIDALKVVHSAVERERANHSLPLYSKPPHAL